MVLIPPQLATTIAAPRRLDSGTIAALHRAITNAPLDLPILLVGSNEGLDLSSLDRAAPPPLTAFATLLEHIHADPRVVLMALDGPVIGAGVALACAADIVIADTTASFSLPEVFYGLIPATVLSWLTQRVGPSHARRMALGAPALDADTALRIGLIDHLAPSPDAVTCRIHQLLTRLARADSRALAAVKTLTIQSPHTASLTANAIATNLALFDTPETLNRLSLAADGHAPWPTEPR